MGKKRRKNRKHLFLHGACFLAVLLLSAGCLNSPAFQKKWEENKYQANKHFELAENLATQRDYEGALKAYEDVVKLSSGDSPGDRALFHMGLIWVYPDNPQTDYEKALPYFQRLSRDFPRSPLKEQAGAWVNAINNIIQCNGRIEELEEAHNLAIKGDYNGALKAYEEVVRVFPGESPGDRALFYMGLICAYPVNPQRNYEKARGYFQRLSRDFPGSPLKEQADVWVSATNELIRYEERVQDLEKTVSVLNKRLNILKEIDIKIEEKKREDRPRK
jgi:TolA-binding protein